MVLFFSISISKAFSTSFCTHGLATTSRTGFNKIVIEDDRILYAYMTNASKALKKDINNFRLLKKLIENRKFDLVIGTSIKGAKWTDTDRELAGKWEKANSALVAFGAPTRGLFEIAKDEGWQLGKEVDFVVNTIPRQGTKTVRTEEAVFASLSIMNMRLSFNA